MPNPPPLTPDDLRRIAEEARRWRDGFDRIRREIETMTPEDDRTVRDAV